MEEGDPGPWRKLRLSQDHAPVARSLLWLLVIPFSEESSLWEGLPHSGFVLSQSRFLSARGCLAASMLPPQSSRQVGD